MGSKEVTFMESCAFLVVYKEETRIIYYFWMKSWQFKNSLNYRKCWLLLMGHLLC